MFRLYLVTDRTLVADLPRAIDRALSGVPRGGAAVQLREKDLGARALLDLARAVAAPCRRHGAPLIVNDRLDVAVAAGADGVHLAGGSVDVADARRLLPRGLVGASWHEGALRAGVDFAVFSPVFPSPGKGPAVGLDALARACTAGVPLLALGGVDTANASACAAAGAHGVAAIRAWLGADDPAEACAALHAAVLRGSAERFSQGGIEPPMTRPRSVC